MSTEIEAKFIVTGRGMPIRIRALESMGRYALVGGTREAMVDVYLDTADRALLAAGYACRRREREGTLLISVKAVASDQGAVHHREELEVTIPRACAPDAWPDSEARKRVLGLIGQGTLEEMLRLRQDRFVRRVLDGERHVADCSLDNVHFADGTVERRWCELEIELTPEGTEADLAAMSAWARESLGLQASGGSKLETALDLVRSAASGRAGLTTASRRAAAPRPAEAALVVEVPEELAGGFPVAALASLGYTTTAGRQFQDQVTFFDTHDGAFLRAGQTIAYSEASRTWSAFEGEVARTARDGALSGKAPNIPYLAAALEETEYTVGGLVAHQLRVLDQRWTFHVPGEESSPPALRRFVISGPATGCAYFSALLQSRLGCQTSRRPLVENGLLLLGVTRPGAPVPSEFLVQPHDTVGRACSRILRGEAWKMRANVRGAILDLDTEFVHDLRVATRRARSALRLFSRFLEPDEGPGFSGELAWIADLLGTTRDHDVLLSRLSESFDRVEAAGDFREQVQRRMQARRESSMSSLAAALRSERFPRLLDSLEVQGDSNVSPPGDNAEEAGDIPWRNRPVRRFARSRIDTTFSKLAPWIDRPAESLSDAELHRIRILFKRLRYACEFFQPLLGDDASELIGSFVGFQDCLGLHQDAVTALRLLSESLAAVPESLRSEGFLLAAGALLQVQRDAKVVQRERFARLWESAPRLLVLWKDIRSALGGPA